MAERETEPLLAVPRCFSELVPEHTIFLSHSGEEKSFVEQLYEDLKRCNYSPFFDQDSDRLRKGEKFPSLIFEAAKECWLAVVVLSKGYLTSKWPMLELSAFVKSRKTDNPKMKVFPLFYKLSPSDLDAKKVETEWAESWKAMVQDGKVQAEEMALWSGAIKDLRPFNGLDFKEYGNSEVKYRAAVVDEICKCVSPMMKYNIDCIRGYQRMCEITASMFEEGMSEKSICKQGRLYLGLHGMGGVGKTTLCGAMCSYFQAEFRGRVCHVELQSDGLNVRIARLKHAVRQLGGFDNKLVDMITSESQGLECLRTRLRDQPPVFLAVDNVGDSQASRDEAQAYLNAGFACGSMVLVTSRSLMILKCVLAEAKYCKPIPRLKELEASELFLSVAAPGRSFTSLHPGEQEIVKACLRECQFADDGYPTQQYHPLVLNALGAYFHDVHDGDHNVMSWDVALREENKLQISRESKHVNDILGLNYWTLDDVGKLIFLDVAFFSNLSFSFESNENVMSLSREWWDRSTPHEWQVSFIATLHGLSPFAAGMKVKELQRKSLIYESGPTLRMHDLYLEFARTLIGEEGSKERGWWVSHLEKNVEGVPRLRLERLLIGSDASKLCRVRKKVQECRNLVSCLVLKTWYGSVNTTLDLRGLNKLRVLIVIYCAGLKNIVCSSDKSSNDLHWSKKKDDVRYLSILRTVKLQGIHLKSVPFLKYCRNIQSLCISFCVLNPYDFIQGRTSLLKYLERLEALSFYHAFDPSYQISMADFHEILRGTSKLKYLRVLEVRQSDVLQDSEDSVIIDLSILEPLSSLSVLSLPDLPYFIEGFEGLEQLSQLTTLNLRGSRGLRNLPELHLLPNLQRVCFYECCHLEDPTALLSKFQDIFLRNDGHTDFDEQDHKDHKCVEPYCNSKYCEACVDRHLKFGCYRYLPDWLPDWLQDSRRNEDDYYCQICYHLTKESKCGAFKSECKLCKLLNRFEILSNSSTLEEWLKESLEEYLEE